MMATMIDDDLVDRIVVQALRRTLYCQEHPVIEKPDEDADEIIAACTARGWLRPSCVEKMSSAYW